MTTSTPAQPIAPDADAVRATRAQLLSTLTDAIGEAWTSFDRPRPAEPEVDAALLERLRATLPEQAGDRAQALADAVHILEASVSPSRPLYLAYVGSSGVEVGVVAAALAATYDANLATAAGAADLLDRQAVEWIADFVGFPLGEGHFTSGGQTSNLTAILVAREQALPGTREHGLAGREAAVYCSAEAHHSVVRAVEAAGLGRRSVRRIAIDEQRRMRPDALDDALAQDLAAGVVPVAVVATAGTTLTGAVDPLDAIADVCARHGVWLHVDGAYGLPAAATALAAPHFRGLERADSVTIDAHKWLGMPKSCSVVLMRTRGALRRAFAHEETYMLHEGDAGNPVDSTLEYSRPFRSLKLWLTMRVHGAAEYREALTRTLEHAARFTDAVRAHPELELLHEPMLSTVCFRHVPADGAAWDDAALDAHNQRLARAVQRDGRVFLAPAQIDGATCLRVCFVNFRTTAEDVATALDVVTTLGAALASERAGA
ncbi:aminotransferase class V-fold PLP-dependent enzyme [Nocardioides sp. TRM66260-LWL]|uniref:pyridoxal phosphate-dependent decarboxylase family protein n=1 Tax=Nocardioides sp. TRM66260-LWL TaxID=2874478 RepID=UPI001CC3D693|nr:aminotransferase class V-fold PLP-dependent enzyme [Nocardioides sp. TRM66260-LWL]MBZ5735284.1 aminotransferase class V-fold PLP-dependent enzyme [Nocardioides sp. TRM66260-LWL]